MYPFLPGILALAPASFLLGMLARCTSARRFLSLSTERRIAFVLPHVRGIRGADAREGAVITARS